MQLFPSYKAVIKWDEFFASIYEMLDIRLPSAKAILAS